MSPPKPRLVDAVTDCDCDNCHLVLLQAAEAGCGMSLFRQTLDGELLQVPMYSANEGVYGICVAKGVIHRYEPKEVKQAAQQLHAKSAGYTLQ
jgi:hypothetical protein